MPIPLPQTDPTHPSFLRELKRKGIHVLALIIPIGLYYFPTKPALFLLFFVTAGSLVVELLRFCFDPIQKLFLRLFGPLLREHEKDLLTGSTALCLSASLCTAAALLHGRSWVLSEEARIALFYAFSFIILGDAAAALFGKLYGSKKILRNKTWAGAVACFITCLGFLLVAHRFTGEHLPWGIGVAGALLTTLLELLPLHLDDNLRVAPVTCVVMYFLLKNGMSA